MNAEQKIEINMYGMTAEQLRYEVENSMYYSVMKDVDFLVMSMLSDAQEIVNYSVSPETIERQRQLLNRAKFVIRYYVMNKEVA